MYKYDPTKSTSDNLLCTAGDSLFTTILADPPWQFKGRQGRLSPEFSGCFRYPTMPLEEIKELPVNQLSAKNAHLYLWIPCSMLPDGLAVIEAWGFRYKSIITWEKIRQDGLPSGQTYGHYFRNTAEFLLFGVKGRLNCVRPSGGICNVVRAQPQAHSRKPDVFHDIIQTASPGPYIELFARRGRSGWVSFGNQADGSEIPAPAGKRNCANCGIEISTACTALECPNYYCSEACADAHFNPAPTTEELPCQDAAPKA